MQFGELVNKTGPAAVQKVRLLHGYVINRSDSKCCCIQRSVFPNVIAFGP